MGLFQNTVLPISALKSNPVFPAQQLSKTRGSPDQLIYNTEKEEFEKVTKENFLPTDVARFYFTPTVVNTGSELVLFDAGLGGETPGILAALASAGYTADQIDVVVLTHMHPDHIGGLMHGGKPTFPNARFPQHIKS